MLVLGQQAVGTGQQKKHLKHLPTWLKKNKGFSSLEKLPILSTFLTQMKRNALLPNDTNTTMTLWFVSLVSVGTLRCILPG